MGAGPVLAVFAGAAWSHARDPFQGRHDIEPQIGLARRCLLVEVAIDESPSRDERAIFAAGAAHDIAPAEMRDRATMRNRVGEGLVDGGMLVLPHGQRGRAQAQIDE